MITSALTQTTQTAQDGGFSVGMLLLFVGGAILLAFFCSIGVIARIRENRLTERKEAAKAQAVSERLKESPRPQGDRHDQQATS